MHPRSSAHAASPASILNHNTTNRLFIRHCLIKQYGSCLNIYNLTCSDLLEQESFLKTATVKFNTA